MCSSVLGKPTPGMAFRPLGLVRDMFVPSNPVRARVFHFLMGKSPGMGKIFDFFQFAGSSNLKSSNPQLLSSPSLRPRRPLSSSRLFQPAPQVPRPSSPTQVREVPTSARGSSPGVEPKSSRGVRSSFASAYKAPFSPLPFGPTKRGGCHGPGMIIVKAA